MQHIYNDMPKNGRYGRVTIYRDKYRSGLTLAYLGILNCYFFIGYLGLLDHEMDSEINLFFSFTKVP